MSMRNFWIESDVDGRESKVASGPRRNDGRMSTRLYVNSQGASTQAVYLGCDPNGDKLNIRTTVADRTIDVEYDKKSGEIVVKDYKLMSIQEVLDNKSITPTQRLKMIQEIIK